MVWFRKDPPPPPPPKSKILGLVGIAVPIIFAILFALTGIVYNGLADEVSKKADKATIKQMLLNQEQLIKMNQQTLSTQQTNIEKTQDSLDDTLKIIQQVQTQQAVMVEQISTPKGFGIITNNSVDKPLLNPTEFQQYMKMSVTEKTGFRKLHPSYESLPK